MNLSNTKISFSVVSHGHGVYVLDFFDSFLKFDWEGREVFCEIVLTLNIPENDLKTKILACSWPFRLIIIENSTPLGFGANQNQAFSKAKGCIFVVVNPDITFLSGYDFWNQIKFFEKPDVGVWVPIQVDCDGNVQDYCRKLITPWGVLMRTATRALGLRKFPGVVPSVEQADWVNGACLFFPRKVFQDLGGFDERYFMYCEDVDICLRLKLKRLQMKTLPVTVVHDAQRSSLRWSKHLRWHIASLLRLWSSSTFWRYCLHRLRKQ